MAVDEHIHRREEVVAAVVLAKNEHNTHIQKKRQRSTHLLDGDVNSSFSWAAERSREEIMLTAAHLRFVEIRKRNDRRDPQTAKCDNSTSTEHEKTSKLRPKLQKRAADYNATNNKIENT